MKHLLTEWRKFIVEQDACSIYRGGMCDAYALAQNQLTDAPMFLVQGKWWDEEYEEWATEPCHLVVKVGENRYLDVDGEKDEEELKQNCFFSGPVEEVEIVPTTPEEAQEIFTTEGVSDEDVERAKDFIRQQQGNK